MFFVKIACVILFSFQIKLKISAFVLFILIMQSKIWLPEQPFRTKRQFLQAFFSLFFRDHPNFRLFQGPLKGYQPFQGFFGGFFQGFQGLLATLVCDSIFGTLRKQQRCSVGKGAVRNFSKFTANHLCDSPYFNKVAGLRSANLLK